MARKRKELNDETQRTRRGLARLRQLGVLWTHIVCLLDEEDEELLELLLSKAESIQYSGLTCSQYTGVDDYLLNPQQEGCISHRIRIAAIQSVVDALKEYWDHVKSDIPDCALDSCDEIRQSIFGFRDRAAHGVGGHWRFAQKEQQNKNATLTYFKGLNLEVLIGDPPFDTKVDNLERGEWIGQVEGFMRVSKREAMDVICTALLLGNCIYAACEVEASIEAIPSSESSQTELELIDCIATAFISSTANNPSFNSSLSANAVEGESIVLPPNEK